MKRVVVRSLVVVVLAQFAGCAAALLAHPASYGAELAACEEKAPAGPAGWDVYIPCCIDVAAKYGRDPAFCFPDAPQDGRAR